MSTPFRLLLPRQLYTAMVEQAQSERPNECCGLLAGKVVDGIGRVEVRYPLVNELASPTRYNANPRGLLLAAKDMRTRGIHELAIYHSHPTSPPAPSRIDLEHNFMGTAVVFLIIGLKNAEPEVRGWWLNEKDFTEAAWEVIEYDRIAACGFALADECPNRNAN